MGAASFRAAPSILIDPLHENFGWSRASISAAVSINLVLYGLTSPFAAALMERFGMRRVVTAALVLVSAGSGLTVFMTATWQLVLLWGVLVGLGTGSMALAFVATVVDRWFVTRRGLVTGILTAGSAAGQLVFLPILAMVAEHYNWQTVALTVSFAALAVVPLVLAFLRNRPSDVGTVPYGAGPDYVAAPPAPTGARRRRGPGRDGAGVGGADPGVLAAGRHVRHLRGEHQRTRRNPLRPGRARPRHAGDGGGEPAGGDRDLRRDRHHRVGVVHRPVRFTQAPRHLLPTARDLADAAADPVREHRAPADDRVRHLLRTRLGGDRTPDGRTVPQTFRRRRTHRVRLGAGVAPDRRRHRGVPRGTGARPVRRLRLRVLRRGRTVRDRRRHVSGHRRETPHNGGRARLTCPETTPPSGPGS
ncbi:MFS transporter [Rhodococcus wratislaviensis IFP 2016]|nr:MFS transporter [Rhodococcus wratislaviensis IFP 2016]